MARIAGVNIPTNKRVEIALTYIHGIGRTKARKITEALGIGPEKRVQDLTDQEVLHIREAIDKAIAAQVRSGEREIAGVRIFEDVVASVR